MRDDLAKLPLPRSAKKYARMKSSDLGQNWSKKVDLYLDMAADLTSQTKAGFKNKDASGKVKHAFKENMEPEDIEAMAHSVETEQRYKTFIHTFVEYFYGSNNNDAIEAWMDVFRTANNAPDVVSGEGDWWEVAETVSDRGYGVAEEKLQLEVAWNECLPLVTSVFKYPYDIDAAKALFERLYLGGKDAEIWRIVPDQSEDLVDPADLAEKIIETLLGEDDELLNQMGDIANSPQNLYKLAREALNFVFGEDLGQVAAIEAALETVGAVGSDGPIICKDGDTLAEHIGIYLSDVDTDGDVDGSLVAIDKTLTEYVPGLAPGAKWALMKIFREEAVGINDNREEADPADEEYQADLDNFARGDVAEAMYDHDGFRGWVSPNGERFPINDGSPHGGEESKELLRQFYPAWDWESNPNFQVNEVSFPAYALQFRGWVRVVGDGVYSTWQLTGQAVSSLVELIRELATQDPDHRVVVDVYLGRRIETTAEDALNQLYESQRRAVTVHAIACM